MTGHTKITVGPNQCRSNRGIVPSQCFNLILYFLSSINTSFDVQDVLCVRLVKHVSVLHVFVYVCGAVWMYSLLAVRHEGVGVLSE